MRATNPRRGYNRRRRTWRYLFTLWLVGLMVSMPAPRYWLWQVDLTAWAAVPWVINYQGRLADSTGNSSVGTYTFTFRLYDEATAGSKQWEEQQTIVLVQADNGIFSVVLGGVTPLDPVSFNDPLWLSVQVNNDSEMTPRQRLTATGFAINADRVDSLDSTKFLRTDIDTTTSGKLTITRSGVALLIKPTTDPAANTTLVDVQNAAGTSQFSVDLEGDTTTAGSLTVGGNLDVTGTITGSTSIDGTVNATWNVGSTSDSTATDLSVLFGQPAGQESLTFQGTGVDDFVFSDDVRLGTQADLRLEDDAGGDYVALQAPTGVTTYTLTLPAAVGGPGQVLSTDASGNLSWEDDATGAGTVTSVALTMPAEFAVAGSPITTSGTLAVTAASQGANTIYAAPDGAAGAPAFRGLVDDDVSDTLTASIFRGSGSTSDAVDLDTAEVSGTLDSANLDHSLDDAYDDGSSVTVDATDAVWNLAGTQDFHIQDAGAAALTVTDGGLVGIGTSNPATLLQLDAAAPVLRLAATGAGGRTADLVANGDQLYMRHGTGGEIRLAIDEQGDMVVGSGGVAGSAQLHVVQTDAADALRIDDVASDTTPFIIDQSGNVGIGTTAPGAMLDIGGTHEMWLNGSFNRFRSPDDNYIEYFAGHNKGTGYGHRFIVDLSREVMRMEGTGFVGIGTTGPAAMLHTQGILSSALTGTVSVSAAAAAVTGAGTAFDTELAVGDAIQIGSEVFTISAITDATNLTLDSNHAAGAAGVIAYTDTSLLALSTGDGATRMSVDNSGNTTLGARADLRFADADSSNWVALEAPATVAGDVTWTLPAADATGCFKSDGAGVVTIGACTTGVSDTLQEAYDAGNTILTGDNRNLAITLADTATDSDFIVNMLGTGNVFEVQDGGTAALSVVDGGDVLVGTGTFDNASGSPDHYVTGNLEVDGAIFGILDSSVAIDHSLDAAYDDGSTVTVDATDVVLNLTGTQDFHIQDAGAAALTVLDTGNVGIGTSNPTNDLQVSGTSALFHSAGDMRINVSKNAVGDTASQIFQNNFSGRAELGLTGDDKFHIKVAPDGSAWADALVIDQTSANVGIGTDTPGAKLHVNGEARALFFSDPADPTQFLDPANTNIALTVAGKSGIGVSPTAMLHTRGNLTDALTGTVSVTAATAAVTGTGTAFDTELQVGDAIKIANEVFTVSAIADATNLTLDSNHTAGAAGVTAYHDPQLLAIDTGDGVSIVKVGKSGRMGIGTSAPSGRLDVEGGDVFLGTGTLTNASASEDLSVTGNLEVDGTIYGTLDAGVGITHSLDAAYDDGSSITVDATDVIWNLTGTQDFHVQDAGAAALTVTDGGLIGIGTTVPGTLLDVDGTIRRYGTAGTLPLYIGSTTGAAGEGLELQYEFANDLGRLTSIERGTAYRDLVMEGSNLRFSTGVGTVTEQIRIDSSGNLGVGTTTPTAQLHERGNLSSALTGTVSVSAAAAAVTGVGTAFDTELAVGDAIKIANEVFTVSAITDATNLTLDSNHSAGAAGVTAYRDPTLLAIDNGDGTRTVTVDKSGNVGIGSGLTNPQRALHVSGVFRLDNVAAPASPVDGDIYSDGTNLFYWDGDSWLTLSGDDDSWIGTTDVTMNTGSVGIGTTAPSSPLDIEAASAALPLGGATAALEIVSTSNFNNGLAELKFGGKSNTIGASIGFRYNDANDNTRGDLVFGTRPVSTDVDLTEQMRITRDGNVGIGTSVPSGKLDVEGGDVFLGTGTLTNASASEDLSVTGNVEVDGIIYGDGSGLTNVNAPITALNNAAADRLTTIGATTTELDGEANLTFTAAAGLTATQATASSAAIKATDGTTQAFLVPNLGAGGWNTLSQAGDVGLIFHDGAQDSGDMVIGPWASGAAGMRITSGGDVGIGSAIPVSKLDVAGTITVSATGALTFSDNSGYGAIDMNGNDIFDARNIGIGTTSPDAPLNVVGQAIVGVDDSTLGYAGGNLVVSEDGASASMGQVDALSIVRTQTGGSWPQIATFTLGRWQTNGAAPETRLDINLKDVSDGTDAAEKIVMTLQSDGNIGIGTTTPGRELHISKNGQPGFAFSDTRGAAGDQTMGVVYDGGISLPTPGLVFQNLNDNGTFNANLMTLLETGNIGIGTTTPVALLEAEGDSADWNETTPGTALGTIHLDPGVATDHFGNAITWGASDSSNGDNGQAGIYVRSDGTYGTKMYLATTNSYATGAQTRMMIDHLGNVGIGTTAPDEFLHVLGGAGTGAIHVESASGHSFITFEEGSENEYWSVGHVDAGAGDGFTIAEADGLASNRRLTILEGGNVGIGTTDPAYPLDVTGDAHITSKVMVNTTTNTGRINALGGDDLPGLWLSGEDNIWFDSGQVRITTHDGAGNWQIKTGADNDDLYVGAGVGAIKLRMDEAGTFLLYTAPAGTLGNPITWNLGLRQDSDGEVGIGVTAARTLHVGGTNGMRLDASALPGSPATGDIAIDSGDSNKLKWHDGTQWQEAGGGGGGAAFERQTDSCASGSCTATATCSGSKVIIAAWGRDGNNSCPATMTDNDSGVVEIVGALGNGSASLTSSTSNACIVALCGQ